MILAAGGLISTLQQQSTLVAELKDLTRQLLQALKEDELQQIAALTEQQEYVGRQLAEQEEQRRQIIAGYADVIGLQVTDIRDINELQAYLGQHDWQQIQIYREEITQNSRAIQQTNELNTLLLKQGLKYADKMLHLLQPQKPRLYGKSGGLNSGGGQALVDTNV